MVTNKISKPLSPRADPKIITNSTTKPKEREYRSVLQIKVKKTATITQEILKLRDWSQWDSSFR